MRKTKRRKFSFHILKLALFLQLAFLYNVCCCFYIILSLFLCMAAWICRSCNRWPSIINNLKTQSEKKKIFVKNKQENFRNQVRQPVKQINQFRNEKEKNKNKKKCCLPAYIFFTHVVLSFFGWLWKIAKNFIFICVKLLNEKGCCFRCLFKNENFWNFLFKRNHFTSVYRSCTRIRLS